MTSREVSEKLTIEESAERYLRRKLGDRRGIKSELELVWHDSPDIWQEIVAELAAELRAVDAAARAEERERCARIAESESAPAGSHEEAYVSATVRRVAAAIREGSHAQP